MRPGPAEEVSLTGEREGRLSLSYSTPREMASFPPGLNHEVTVSNEHQQGVVVVVRAAGCCDTHHDEED